MRTFKMIVGGLLGALLVVFALQNVQEVSLYFFNLSFGAVPLFLVIILVFILGFICGRLTSWAKNTFTRKK